MIKVYKFGGASVKDATNIIRLANQLKEDQYPHKVVVISAMGKMTNAFERLANAYFEQNSQDKKDAFDYIYQYHSNIISELFNQDSLIEIEELFEQIETKIADSPSLNFDFEYDQIVSFGELLSTKLISKYISHAGLNNSWVDIRPLLRTSENYREGVVDWQISEQNIRQKFRFKTNNVSLYITQGFIASTYTNLTTTLGREGSDYSAAIVAKSLEADSLTIWKDVDGVLNADPRYFTVTEKIEFLSYRDAIELAYFGASVIHPKTLKPLRDIGIPLFVKNFHHTIREGTMIGKQEKVKPLPPIYILKKDQVLITIADRGLSFLTEEDIAFFYQALAFHQAKSNLVQQSALYFSVVIDKNDRKFSAIIEQLMQKYQVKYNDGLELLTIQNSNPTRNSLDYISHKELLIEQHNRKTSRYLVKQ
ncbi:aspartate kinase [Halosquirtibacter laminarini]|uniref:Aspartate kinase n=1 Tax=Halosquirtibacter laminarini TaxID=3374600 RepID=A0AC61NFX5_9BACT|nr:aspartate kinase [Prolixibacteraceae bacterium]